MNVFEDGKFYLGCNWWGSESGLYMWRNWNEQNVYDDFKLLSEAGVKLVRVFPLWSDFQPVTRFLGYCRRNEGYSKDGGLTVMDSSDDGTDPVMMDRFERVLDIAEEYGLKVIPTILTGWMSGAIFVPPILTEKNLLTDPFAIMWEIRFLRAFVKRFKNHNAIAAWCAGNECACLDACETREQAWLWINAMTDAIKAEDETHEVISGIHTPFTPNESKWVIDDIAECCDYLAVHPYASDGYTTGSDNIYSIKPMLQPAMHTVYSQGLSKKPCIIQETGTYGEMYTTDELTAKYVEGNLFSAWAHGCKTHMWWIGFDQGKLRYHPFSLNNRGSNYGLYREDRTLKPVGNVYKDFSAFLETFPYEKLPKRVVDAVCILSPYQNTFRTGLASFVLAKQVGIDMEFSYILDTIPEAKAYFIPSLKGANSCSADFIEEIMHRVENGATLYLSAQDGFIKNLGKDFGFRINRRKEINKPCKLKMADTELDAFVNAFYDIDKTSAVSLATDENGNDLFLKSPYGKGTVYFSMFPVESFICEKIDAYENSKYYRIYEEVKKSFKTDKVATCDNHLIGMTEHIVNDNERIIIVTNLSENTQIFNISHSGWEVASVLRGDVEAGTKITLENAKTAVFVIKK